MMNDTKINGYMGGYIQVPLPFVRLLMVHPKKARDVVRYCIYQQARNKSLNSTIDKDKILTHLIYIFYLNVKSVDTSYYLDEGLYNTIENVLADAGAYNEDYYGFSGNGEFEPFDELKAMKEFWNQSKENQSLILEWYFVNEVRSNSFYQDDKDVYPFRQSYLMFSKYHEQLNNSVWGYCKTQRLVRIANLAESGRIVPNDILMRLAMYIGLKSVLGTNMFAHYKTSHIKARMFGYSSKTEKLIDITDWRDKEELDALEKKYTSQRQFKKLLESMTTGDYPLFRSLIPVCGNRSTQGIWFSSSLSFEELQREIETSYRGSLESKMKSAQKNTMDALKRIKEEMTQTNTAQNESEKSYSEMPFPPP